MGWVAGSRRPVIFDRGGQAGAASVLGPAAQDACPPCGMRRSCAGRAIVRPGRQDRKEAEVTADPSTSPAAQPASGVRRIGLLTGGGDAPGLNAVIRSVVLAADRLGWECHGIRDGFNGLLAPGSCTGEPVRRLGPEDVHAIGHLGGTILGSTNRGNPLRYPTPQPDGSLLESDRTAEVVARCRERGLEALVVVGGDGSMGIAEALHRQGLRVVVLYPAEALNMPASNALLKTLEEPPPGTVFLLASNGLDRLLPTILSRCRKFALPMPEHAAALAWLKEQGVPDADSWLREEGGAPLAARAQAELGNREELDSLLHFLARPSAESALKNAEKLSKTPLAALVAWQQRWLYDLLSVKLSGVVRYYPRYQKELAGLAGNVHTANLLRAVKSTNERRAVADHPLSAKLFVEDMLLDYTRCCSPA